MCIDRSSSPKVVDFGTNRKGMCDFLLITNGNFGPVLHHFWDTALAVSQKRCKTDWSTIAATITPCIH